jgi:hypothetical protein
VVEQNVIDFAQHWGKPPCGKNSSYFVPIYKMKIVVFDLDETLGYFVEYGIFWDCLKKYLNEALNQNEFNEILDIYPEFLRPNIMNILIYLKHKKTTNSCQQIMMYTNNQKAWASQLISYFETNLHFKLFDQVISAFKVNGKRIEMCRTSQDKSYDELMRCTRLPPNAEICFLDNHYFPNMVNKNIYYINLKPYIYQLKFSEMIVRFLQSVIGKRLIKDPDDFEKFMTIEYNRYDYKYAEKNSEEYEIDKIIGKQIMSHLQDFFKTSNKTTKRMKKNTKTKTFRRK